VLKLAIHRESVSSKRAKDYETQYDTNKRHIFFTYVHHSQGSYNFRRRVKTAFIFCFLQIIARIAEFNKREDDG
jgi:uncharacterized FlgJ-related protein